MVSFGKSNPHVNHRMTLVKMGKRTPLRLQDDRLYYVIPWGVTRMPALHTGKIHGYSNSENENVNTMQCS